MPYDSADRPESAPDFALQSRELLRRSRDLLRSSHALLHHLKAEHARRRAQPVTPEPPPPPG